MIDEGGSIADESFSGAMQRLQIRLRLALHWHEAHRRPCCGFGDRLRVTVIVLLRLDVGPHVLRRHQPHLVPGFSEDPPKMMRAAAGFHRNDAAAMLAHDLG